MDKTKKDLFLLKQTKIFDIFNIKVLKNLPFFLSFLSLIYKKNPNSLVMILFNFVFVMIEKKRQVCRKSDDQQKLSFFPAYLHFVK